MLADDERVGRERGESHSDMYRGGGKGMLVCVCSLR
jgi:hypothetical protein